MPADFDIVIHGATGFTGRLVAEYMAQRYPNAGNPEGIRWAMGGRSADKLAAVRDEIGAPADTPLVVTDLADPASLAALMDCTRLVLTTVGPYQLYGNALVAACAARGVHYVDLCGEPAWMRQMIDAHQATAQASGARIVFSCGFDSIPFDLGVFYLQQAFAARHGHAANRVRGRVRKMKGTFSGGTAASLTATLAAAAENPQVQAWMRDPFALTPGFEGPKQPVGHKPMVDEALGQVNGEGVWVAPFVMAAINTKNVHRSNALLGHAWGTDFAYDEMLVTGPGARGEQIALAVAADKSLGGEGGPKPGEGPSKAEREAGFYDLLFLGEDAQGQRLAVGVSGDKDPGYGSTSKMIAESAVCLLKDAGALPGGIWTTAPAMGAALVARLQAHAGLRFTVEG
ncbi:saccharopine dehydrogenase family protein [Aquabacterium sp. OR-4]|uniref:saccharopine dehydrogenase family protein n=1 Tax=Aquabacterium sp. OR-4 TaxID=2978127 RepID=UPI0028C7EAA3|nr:saccharopine dehydrogenase NADP-binding domain-containing protein [Aquabacterium sp. OR-4]MDT7839041.1 saccharopine dehydrogenase NADP-binding domain-containing protein [Aquabacterium sp. OR-4]